MASNDGQRLLVFGLTFKQHDNRSMQRILREYGRLPANPDRAGLYVALTALASYLDKEKSEGIKNWLQNGGEFPSPSVATSAPEFGRLPDGSPIPPDSLQATRNFYNNGPAHRALNRLDARNRPFPPPQVGRGFDPWTMGGGHPGLGHMGMPGLPAFIDGRTGYNPRPTAAFTGAGRSLVDIDDVEPQFPTAHNHNDASNPESLYEDERMYQVPRGEFRTEYARRNGMQGLSLAEFQRQQQESFGMNAVGESFNQLDIADTPTDDGSGQEIFQDDAEDDDDVDIEDEDEADDDIEVEDEDGMDVDNLPRGLFPPHPDVSTPVVASTQLDEPTPEGYLECCVCAYSQPPEKFTASPKITSTCDHADDSLVCLDCIEQAVRTPIDDGILNLITCPLCPEKLSHSEIKLYASERIFARYQYLRMSLDPDMVFCLAPNCGSGQVHSVPEHGPTMTCEKCTFKTCAHHKLPWHEGMTCEEFDCDESQIERLEQDEATAKLLAKLASKICPTCKQGVDRTDGCDHLTCRCGGEWCFECLASWENILRIGDTAHAVTCPNHPNRVQLRQDQKEANEARILESVHGGKISDALQSARVKLNAKRRETIRPLAAEAAERRMQEAKAKRAQQENSGPSKKQKKTKLIAPWEEH